VSALADWLARQPTPERTTPAQRRALAAIRRCRTPELGGHVYRCTDCTKTDFAYHSCNHRACPRCGGTDTAEWTQRQTERLLPVPYFLVTFTVPAELRLAFTAQPVLLHDLLFTQAAHTLQEVAAVPRLLGAELGFVGVLHTWGRKLQHHPHVHFVVPGGGLRGAKWIGARQPDWLLPVAKLATAFRRRTESALRASAPALHATVPAGVWRGRWVVHSQPAGTGANVVRYLARYVGRTAISDERIVAADDSAVTFRYTDSATQQRKQCTLSAAEFLRRYLQHVLPPGQHRVRYFGWMHPAAKARRMLVETALAMSIVIAPLPVQPQWHLRCAHCGAFTLVRVASLARRARAPPICAAA
jgi:hypothetical protein